MKAANYFFRKCDIKRFGLPGAFCIAFTLSTVTLAQTAKPDYSGKWVLNTEKSQAGSIGDVKGIYIEQNNDTITIRSIFKGEDGQNIAEPYKYTLDGSIITTEIEVGSVEVVAKWSGNGKSFTISSSYIDEVGGDFDGNTCDEYEISEDLKTLTIRQTSDFTSYRIDVYDKACN